MMPKPHRQCSTWLDHAVSPQAPLPPVRGSGPTTPKCNNIRFTAACQVSKYTKHEHVASVMS